MMEVKKVFLVVVLLSYTFVCSFAQNMDIWSGASADTQKALAQVDKLITQRQYESAYNLLTKAKSDEYIIAKELDVLCDYFVVSIGHQFFALKDLSKEEDLMELRNNYNGTINMLAAPVDAAEKIISDGNKTPVLYRALGDYYYEVYQHYGDSAPKGKDFKINKILENYGQAYQKNFYTADMLKHYSSILIEVKQDYRASKEVAEKLLKLDPQVKDVRYNLAVADMALQLPDQALEQAKLAIIEYKDNLDYLFDSLLVAADASAKLKKMDDAIDYINQTEKISTQDYRTFQQRAKLYLQMGKLDLAAKDFDSLLDLEPSNHNATRVVTQLCSDLNQTAALLDFFTRNIKRYAKQDEVLANLYFYQAAFQYLKLKDYTNAQLNARKAQELYQKLKLYDGYFQETIETIFKSTPKN